MLPSPHHHSLIHSFTQHLLTGVAMKGPGPQAERGGWGMESGAGIWSVGSGMGQREGSQGQEGRVVRVGKCPTKYLPNFHTSEFLKVKI